MFLIVKFDLKVNVFKVWCWIMIYNDNFDFIFVYKLIGKLIFFYYMWILINYKMFYINFIVFVINIILWYIICFMLYVLNWNNYVN